MGSPPDHAEDVLVTASLLDITEFELFSMAYRAWHCDSASERHLERYFAPYMFQGRVPVWVQQFTRQVLSERGEEIAALDVVPQSGCLGDLGFAMRLFFPPPSPRSLGPLRFTAMLA